VGWEFPLFNFVVIARDMLRFKAFALQVLARFLRATDFVQLDLLMSV